MNANDDSSLDCREVSSRLPALIDGELPEDAARDVERHLARCARCARERAGFEQLAGLFARDRDEGEAAPADVAEARLGLRRTLERERVASHGSKILTGASGRVRTWLLRSRLSQAAGFALLFALLVPVFPRVNEAFAPAPKSNVATSIANEARELVASVGTWLPSLPEWRLPAAPPESLKAWFGALHSDAH